ncbi:high affinity immunoglobulin epsilon receptor subunit alpha-like isoform X2 [Passer montanus]|uniref:high affinity immunoglobulin epsilon receptor subunit alpha-like isoform X2 n=1 Tax=Passer montanus TaxID=9160 RepID=UPI001961AF45|nr:high affinity immunoglobulin epsilon receptor subunit alpha-like isoform X2 [Passer montanus]
MAGDTRMAGKVVLLLWAQTLGLAGAQTTQLLVDPPWTPAVLWDQVTLTCQGSGTTGATTWYKDGQYWGQEGRDNITVMESGTYMCDRPGSGCSPSVKVSEDKLVLQVPARVLLQGETMTMRCRYRQDISVHEVFFYREETELVRIHNGTQLSLTPLQLNHTGCYHCRVWMNYGVSQGWEKSALVTVTVNGEHLTAATPTPPQPFPRDSGSRCPQSPIFCPELIQVPVVGGPQGSPELLLPALRVFHSGNYSCEVHSEGGLCGRAVPGSASWCAVSAGMGTGSPHSLLRSPAWVPPCPSDTFLGCPCLCPVSSHPSIV